MNRPIWAVWNPQGSGSKAGRRGSGAAAKGWAFWGTQVGGWRGPNRASDVPHDVPVREPSPGGAYGTPPGSDLAWPGPSPYNVRLAERRTGPRVRRTARMGIESGTGIY